MFINISPWSEFEDEVDAFVVVEVPIQAQNVDVAKIGLDLDFTPDLKLHLRLDYLGFINYLQAQTYVAFHQVQAANTTSLAITSAHEQVLSQNNQRLCTNYRRSTMCAVRAGLHGQGDDHTFRARIKPDSFSLTT